ncbi:cytochrome c oxidase subunit 7A-related protein, mitochondrial isoform X2 [Sapajus apella]|uniref:Cytochrome c oxidase subunit 7A-related protein, mitochondrial isoform X2 n=1 Tax=Sapajus apella TaxID=9515 RepID=A0A6J3ERH7_SAPAP|nr:cytochrome c oxidase subunit 7A-related protein, mitochondrial isoform X2 [Sapajus apella]
MYYKFSGFTQKLAGAWASEAYSPQGLKPVVPTEAPPIIFATPTKVTSDSTVYDYAGKNRVPELQKFFQVREDTLDNREACEINRLKKSVMKLILNLVYYPTSSFFFK